MDAETARERECAWRGACGSGCVYLLKLLCAGAAVPQHHIADAEASEASIVLVLVGSCWGVAMAIGFFGFCSSDCCGNVKRCTYIDTKHTNIANTWVHQFSSWWWDALLCCLKQVSGLLHPTTAVTKCSPLAAPDACVQQQCTQVGYATVLASCHCNAEYAIQFTRVSVDNIHTA